MGLRFRRSVRLFPGVRLNFSRSGVSTSVGVRGASMTFGPRGTYANVGLPGSGISYRTRLDAPAPRVPAGPARRDAPQLGPRSPILSPGVASIPGTEVKIESADVTTLTSPGLDELKQLIKDAVARHAELAAEVSIRTRTLRRARRKLRWSQFFIIRLLTRNVVPRLVDAANFANDALDEAKSHLDGCYVEVDIPFDDSTRQSYTALQRTFENLKTSQRIWDITATAAVDRFRQRTTAYSAITRVRVRFDFSSPEIVRCAHPAMRLGNIGGRDLQIFPGFVMMREGQRDFALIEFGQFACEFGQSNYIEEETVPADAVQIGTTWKRANKDGSRDRRFNNNYQIPIMRYGSLSFGSPTGLAEIYQVSDFAKASEFAGALAAHKRALQSLTTPANLPSLPAATDFSAEPAEDALAIEPRFVAKARNHLEIDWILLVMLMSSLALGGGWLISHQGEIRAALTPPAVSSLPSAQATPAPVHTQTPKASSSVPTKSHHRTRRHHAHRAHATSHSAG